MALHMLSASHASLPEKTWNNGGAAAGGAAPAVAAAFVLILSCSLALLDEHLSRNIGRVRPTSPPLLLPLLPALLLFVSSIVDVAGVEEALLLLSRLSRSLLLLSLLLLLLLLLLQLLLLRRTPCWSWSGFAKASANVFRRSSCLGLAVARRSVDAVRVACSEGTNRSKVAAKERAADKDAREVEDQATRIRKKPSL